MPKGTGAPLRPRKEPITDDHIRASVAAGMSTNGHYGEITIAGIPTKERALDIKRSLFRCGKWLGYSITAQITGDAGAFRIVFKAIDKDIGRAYIAAKHPNGEGLPYNPWHKAPQEQA